MLPSDAPASEPQGTFESVKSRQDMITRTSEAGAPSREEDELGGGRSS